MRILLVSFSTLPTMQRYLYFASDELINRGHEVWTVGSSQLAISRDLLATNRTVVTPATPRPSVRSVMTARRVVSDLVASIDELKPDVIHFVNKHTWNALLIGALRLGQNRARIVHTFHDPVGHEGDRVKLGVIAYHKLVQRILDGIIVHSELASRQTRERLRPRCRVVKVPLGVARWSDEMPRMGSGKKALIFGRLNSYKGCELYPQLFEEIHRLDPAVRTVIAGRPAPELSSRLIEEIRMAPGVELIDRFVPDNEIDSLFSSAAAVLTPYTSMTQSGVIIDAYSRARATVAFAIDGMREAVVDPENLVTPFDVPAYARAVVDFLNNPQLIVTRGQSAWTYGKSHYAPERMAQELEAAYELIGAR